MDIVNSVLNAAMLAAVLVIASFAMIIRSLVQYMPRKADLQPKLREIEAEIEKFRKHTRPKQKSVSDLAGSVKSLEDRHQQLQSYADEFSEALASLPEEADARDIRLHDFGRS